MLQGVLRAYRDGTGIFAQFRETGDDTLVPRPGEATLLLEVTGDLESAEFQREVLAKAVEANVPETKVKRLFPV